MTGVRYQPLTDPIYPPKQGRWVVCGFGRFGKAIYKRLKDEGIDPVVIESAPEKTGLAEMGLADNEWVLGWGTEAVTLQEAGIDQAVGLVAGTDNDPNNLSIIMTAKDLNPNLFAIVRQNHDDNERIFQAVDADTVMHPSSIIANKIRVLLGTPLLYEFVGLAMYESDAWACELVSRVSALVHNEVPEVWELEICEEDAFAVHEAIERGSQITLRDLLADPQQRDQQIMAIPLLRLREGARELLPGDQTSLKIGDRLLICGRSSSRYRMEWTLQNAHALSYIKTGEAVPHGWLWRWMSRRLNGRKPENAG